MTLNEPEWPCYVKFCFWAGMFSVLLWLSATTAWKQIFALELFAVKYSTGILVSGNVRFIWIFVGIPREGASNDGWMLLSYYWRKTRAACTLVLILFAMCIISLIVWQAYVFLFCYLACDVYVSFQYHCIDDFFAAKGSRKLMFFYQTTSVGVWLFIILIVIIIIVFL